jgi:hypothetical protein
MATQDKEREITPNDPVMTPAMFGRAANFMMKIGEPLLVIGSPGQGKSTIIEDQCKELGYDILITHPVVEEPIDYKGFPFTWKDDDGKTHAAFVPYGHMMKLVEAERPIVHFADDAGQAPKAVQAAYMQWILGRQINDVPISEHVRFVAASNRKQDKAGVQAFLEPLKDRFTSVIELITSMEDWVAWAIPAKVPFEVISYVRYVPQILEEWEPTSDFSRTATPRGICQVGKMLEAGCPKELQLKLFAGAIGSARAQEFIGFLRIFTEIPDPDDILLNPTKADIPKDPGHLYALCGALAARATPNNIERLITYADRFDREEFNVLMVRDAIARDRKKLCKTPAFTQWVSNHQDVLV